MWKGLDDFWIEAWTVRGRRVTEGGRLSPEQATRLRRGLQAFQEDVAQESLATGSRFQSAETHQHG